MAFNKSLETSNCPEKLKVEQIIIIHKSDERRSVTKYRPISVIHIFSKFLKRLMYNRLAEFLDINNILVQNQYGFRQKQSTFMALLKLVDDISEELDKKNYSFGVFIDP